MTRVCNTCGITKPFSAFHKEKRCRLGIRPKCKACRRGDYMSEEYKAARRAVRNQREAEYRKVLNARHRKNPSRRLLVGARNRAKRLGLAFNLDITDVSVPTVCPILGIPLFVSQTKSVCHNSPTLDRIDPSLGYTKGNVVVISSRANRMKQDCTPDMLLKMWIFYEKHRLVRKDPTLRPIS